LTVADSTPDSPIRPDRVQRLLSEYQTLRRRYGLLEQHPRLAGLDRATDRRSFRAKHLREQIEELADEDRWLESELESFNKGRELVLVGVIDELRTKFREAWSPLPVLGFRYWFVKDGTFLGFRQRWSKSIKDADCLTTRVHEEVPHTDGRCGPPACGIYAAKQVRNLLMTMEAERVTDRPVAVGLVGLSGKVVEHRFGYRSARAEVLAIAVVQPGREMLFVDDGELLGELFSNAEATARWLTMARDPVTSDDPASRKASLIGYMKEQERNHAWTSENKNE